MCGRYTVLTEDEIIQIRGILREISLNIVSDDFCEYKEHPGDVCPSDHAPIITGCADGVIFESAKWGFQKWSGSGVIFNARSETLCGKGTFSALVKSGRCVVPAGEFFEWKRLGSGKKKYYARDKHGNLLFMAGLYRDTPDVSAPSGYVREFVIITKEATGEMAEIHDRMPVILRTDQIEPWLTGKITPDDAALSVYDVSVLPCDASDADQLSMF